MNFEYEFESLGARLVVVVVVVVTVAATRAIYFCCFCCCVCLRFIAIFFFCFSVAGRVACCNWPKAKSEAVLLFIFFVAVLSQDYCELSDCDWQARQLERLRKDPWITLRAQQ